MKKYLLPHGMNNYKANLHCHTYLSDGRLTPEEIKAAYLDRGYSIVAFTDHDIVIDHSDLNDDRFLALHGCELEVNASEETWRTLKTCHMCCIKLDPQDVNQVCYHREQYLYANSANQRDRLVVDASKPDFVREYSHEGVSAMMKEARDSGCFVTYNHPTSSLEQYPDYIGYENMHALELINSCGEYAGGHDYCPHVYDDLLRAGKRLYAIAGDDTHSLNFKPQGWTMIRAEKLEYRTVTHALMAGAFYVTQGPLIDDVWVEDNVLHITTSPVDYIEFYIGTIRECKTFHGTKEAPLTQAAYPLKPDYPFVRITIRDAYGKHAHTNAFYMDEIMD